MPLNHPNKSNIINGTYLKDIDNEFDPYIGTWQGTWNDKIFTLKIEKISHYTNTYPNGDYYYRDLLIGNYIVTDLSTELELANSLSITNPELAKVISYYRPSNNVFYFHFNGGGDICDVLFTIHLKQNLSNPNELIYTVGEKTYWESENCPYNQIEDIPIPIPSSAGSLTLTKIN